MFRIGSVVDILFKVDDSLKPFEGIVVNITSKNKKELIHVSFSNGEYKVFQINTIIEHINYCNNWKRENPQHIRGDPNNWNSKVEDKEADIDFVYKMLKSRKVI